MATKIRMEHATSDVGLHVASPSKSAANLIEWNVDMRVTVSNVRKSKLLQKSRNIVILILAVIFAIVLSHLRREVRALQVQMQCVNVNLLVLMSKYDRLNRSLNRAWFQRPGRLYESNVPSNLRRFHEGVSLTTKTSEIFDSIHNATNESSYAYSSVVPLLSPAISLKDKFLLSNDTHTKDREIEPRLESAASKLVDTEGADDKTRNNSRFERAVLTFEKQNSSAIDVPSKRVTRVRDEDDDDDDDKDGIGVWNEHRSARARRDEGRGKNRGKNKRRPKRSRRRLGPLVATFVGAIPEQHVTDTVYVGPWVKSTKNDSQYSLNKFHLVEDKKSIEVTTSGLYMISAQIFYFGEPTNYSYWILLSSEGKSTTQKLVKCSTASSTSATEVSCYTSVITLLRRGDRLHIQQQERDRLINMREGHSYIQLVLLSDSIRKRRVT